MTTTVPTAALAPSRPPAWTISIASGEGRSRHRDPTTGALAQRPLVDEVRRGGVLAGVAHGLEDRDLLRGPAARSGTGEHLAQLGRRGGVQALQLGAARRRGREGLPGLDEERTPDHGLPVQLGASLVG